MNSIVTCPNCKQPYVAGPFDKDCPNCCRPHGGGSLGSAPQAPQNDPARANPVRVLVAVAIAIMVIVATVIGFMR